MRAVEKAVEAEPEKFGHLVAEMDASGHVQGSVTTSYGSCSR